MTEVEQAFNQGIDAAIGALKVGVAAIPQTHALAAGALLDLVALLEFLKFPDPEPAPGAE